MSYLSIDELKTLIPLDTLIQLSVDDSRQLTDAYDNQTVNDTVVQAVINDAGELVDGYLRGRYSLPFTDTPTLIKQCARQVARYMLYERRPEGQDIPEAVSNGYKNAIKLLEQIRDAKVSLGVQANETGAGQIIDDDGEFHVRVRPAKDNRATFSHDLLDQY